MPRHKAGRQQPWSPCSGCAQDTCSGAGTGLGWWCRPELRARGPRVPPLSPVVPLNHRRPGPRSHPGLLGTAVRSSLSTRPPVQASRGRGAAQEGPEEFLERGGSLAQDRRVLDIVTENDLSTCPQRHIQGEHGPSQRTDMFPALLEELEGPHSGHLRVLRWRWFPLFDQKHCRGAGRGGTHL